MRFLVSGAAGFIGSHVVERILTEGHEVVAIDSFDSYLYPASCKELNIARISAMNGFRLVRGDICDRQLVLDLCQGCDVVVHLAALAGVRPSIADPPRYARANVEGTLSVLEACRMAGVKRFVFASSSSVYGTKPLDSAEFREDDPCLSPASPYAATKRAGELICSTYRDLFGIGIFMLRFFTVYGPRQRPDMAIHKFTKSLLAGEAVTLFGDGSSVRDYTYVDDIVDGVWSACNHVSPNRLEIYNLGGGHPVTLRELIELLAANLRVECKIDWQPDQPGDVPVTRADISKARRDLGYRPQVGIGEGLERFARWYRTR